MFNERVKGEFNTLPISEETMKATIKSFKEDAMALFKNGVLGGSDILNTPKGEEFLRNLERE